MRRAKSIWYGKKRGVTSFLRAVPDATVAESEARAGDLLTLDLSPWSASNKKS